MSLNPWLVTVMKGGTFELVHKLERGKYNCERCEEIK